MIRHIVLFRWSERRTDDQLRALGAVLDTLPGLIPEILSYEYGPDLGLAEANYDFAVTGTFADAASHAVYREHPAHLQMVAEHITGRVAERVAVQFDVGG